MLYDELLGWRAVYVTIAVHGVALSHRKGISCWHTLGMEIVYQQILPLPHAANGIAPVVRSGTGMTLPSAIDFMRLVLASTYAKQRSEALTGKRN